MYSSGYYKILKKFQHCNLKKNNNNSDVFLAPITHYVNLSIRQSTFPNCYKAGSVFNTGDPTNVANYRLISILSLVSKIVENVVTGQIVNVLDTQNNLLCSM